MKKFKIPFYFFAISVGLLSFTGLKDMPEGWFKAGSLPDQYDIGTDHEIFVEGNDAAFIASKVHKVRGFGTLMKTQSTDQFRGKKVRMTAYVKTQNLESWAGMWMRIDDETGNKELKFDNMGDRPIRRTTDWTKYEIVLKVPVNSGSMSYGVLMAGGGKLWFDDVQIQVAEGHARETESCSGSNRRLKKSHSR